MSCIPGFFVNYEDRLRCVEINRRLGFEFKPFRYSDCEEDFARETLNNLCFRALKVNGAGVVSCRVGSFFDIWQALNRAKAGDETYKGALKKLCYSVEEDFQEELGRRYAAAIAAAARQKEFEETQEKERARIAQQNAEREALELAAKEERAQRGRK